MTLTGRANKRRKTMPVPSKGVAASSRRQVRARGDFYRWAFEQAALMRANNPPDLDAENIAEELESLGRQEFGKLQTALTMILSAMLVWDHQPKRRNQSRASSIRLQRRRYDKVLKKSPSLTSRRDEALAFAYEIARLTASSETDLPLRAFPASSPYSWFDIIERPFAIDPDDA